MRKKRLPGAPTAIPPAKRIVPLTDAKGTVPGAAPVTVTLTRPAPPLAAATPGPMKFSVEVADSIVLLCALASEFDVDVESAVRAKFVEQDAQRQWPSAEL